MRTDNIEQRRQKIEFVQQQLNLLQTYGAYGYEVLQVLRERIQQLHNSIEESWQADAFIFSYQNQIACSFYWQDEDSVCIALYDKIGERIIEFAHEYKKGKTIEWLVITGSISNYINELEGKLSSVMIKEV